MSNTITLAPAEACACQAGGYICANADQSCTCDCHGARPLAGATYPMPPKPVWATGEPDLSEEAIAWCHSLADTSDTFAVFLGRSDWIQPHCITVGEVEIHAEVAEQILTVEQAHRLAALLVQAADMAEGAE
jgi:hypothetical protein